MNFLTKVLFLISNSSLGIEKSKKYTTICYNVNIN